MDGEAGTAFQVGITHSVFVLSSEAGAKNHRLVIVFRLKELIAQWRIKAHKLQSSLENASIKMCPEHCENTENGISLSLNV